MKDDEIKHTMEECYRRLTMISASTKKASVKANELSELEITTQDIDALIAVCKQSIRKLNVIIEKLEIQSEDCYAKTGIVEECEQCNSKDTVTYVKRVYITTDVVDNGWSDSLEMPYLQYKQTCKKCGHEQIYHLQ